MIYFFGASSIIKKYGDKNIKISIMGGGGLKYWVKYVIIVPVSNLQAFSLFKFTHRNRFGAEVVSKSSRRFLVVVVLLIVI